ncbi:MFS transporter [Microseira wollei]|uniref:General substrate transporter n=1 Tax=Microseira wollei NIES-4236 TaxID=2530354 RepID=A0AAV3XQK4_9CYAN|nr:MFS transporter [Microseira wollei]GET43440.1 general substrate transporter [Microseira wollei NIES-4236]
MKVFSTLEKPVRRNLVILFAAGLLFWCSMASLLPTLPTYVEDIGGTKQEIGTVMGGFAIGLLLFRPRLGRMVDRQSRKGVLLLGIVVAAIAPLGYLFVKSIPLLIALRAFHGISIAAFTTAYSTLVVDLSPSAMRGELIGYMSLVQPIGVALGPAMGGLLQEQAGYPALFLLTALLAVFSGIGAAAIREARGQGGVGEVGDTSLPPGANSPFWRLLLSPRLRIPTLVMLLIGLAFGALSTFVPLYIRETKVDLNPGWFYTAAAIASFSLRLFIGRASDRYGRGLFITGSLLCYTVAMFMLSSANSAVAFLLAGAIEGAGGGTFIPMVIALISDRSSSHERGRVFALCVGGFDLGMAIAGPVFGSFAQQLGYRGIFTLSTGLAFLALVIFLTQCNKDVTHSLKFALGRERDTYALDR